MSKRKARGGAEASSAAEESKSRLESDNESESDEQSGSEIEIVPPKKKKAARKLGVTRQKKRSAAYSESDDDGYSDNEGDDEVEDLRPREAGQILRVELDNFMNHDKLDLKFGRHLNFITGRNGSGKSAVVAAIQTCLGGSAKLTGRGSSVKGFIKEGRREARVRLTLLNEGPDAHRPQDYGKRIIIERRFGASVSGYHLYDENKKEVASTRAELDKVMRTFSIYPNNPCCILTQEFSKKFLHGSPKERYQFFEQATGIQLLGEELARARDQLNLAQQSFEEHQPKLEIKRDAYKKAHSRLQRYLKLDQFEAELKINAAKQFWVKVRDAEQVVEAIEGNVEKARADTEKAQEGLNALLGDDGKNSIEQRMADIQAELDAAQGDINALAARRAAKVQEVAKVKRALDSAVNLKHNVINNKNAFQKRLEVAQKELNEINQRAMGQAQEAALRLMEERNGVQEQITSIEADIKQTRVDREQSQSNSQDLARQLNQVTSSQRFLSSEITRIEGSIRELSNDAQGTANRAQRCGNDMRNILGHISRTQFRGPVIGPLGTCVQIREGFSQWNAAFERAFGGMYRAFIVTNSADQKAMCSILQAVGGATPYNTTIIVQPTRPRYQVQSALQGMEGGLVVMDGLQIEEDLVFNALVDHLNINSVALVEDESHVANRYVTDDGRGHDLLINNLNSCLTKKGDKIYFARGNRASETAGYSARNYLNTDSSQMLRQYQEELQERRAEAVETNAQKQRLEADVRESRQVITATEQSLKSAEMKRRGLQRQYDDLSQKLHDAQQEAQEVDTSGQEEEIQELLTEIASLETQLEELQAQVEAGGVELDARKSEKAMLDQEEAELRAQLETHEAALEEVLKGREDQQRQESALRRKFDRATEALARFEREFTKAQSSHRSLEQTARVETRKILADWDGAPLRVTNRDTQDTIKRMIVKLQAQLDQGKRENQLEGCDKEKLQRSADRAERDYRNTVEICDKLTERLGLLESDLVDRARRYDVAKRESGKRIKKGFDEYLQDFNYSGTLRLDHREKEIIIEVQLDNTDKSTRTKTVSNLSGGEKSVSTFCFLLALGYALESPFRVMDEPDVYMDEQRRGTSLTTLTSYIQKPQQLGRQCLCITPNSLAQVNTTDRVRIVKMPDPKRNSAHGLQQTTIDQTAGVASG